jgi:hypothetical protein
MVPKTITSFIAFVALGAYKLFRVFLRKMVQTVQICSFEVFASENVSTVIG